MNGQRHAGQQAASAGFALVEVLVAAAILASITALYMRTVASEAAARQMIEERREAVMVARSALEQAGVRGRDLARGGADGRFVWDVQVTRESASRSEGLLTLERVRVTVRKRDGGAPVVSLSTLRLGR